MEATTTERVVSTTCARLIHDACPLVWTSVWKASNTQQRCVCPCHSKPVRGGK